MTGEVSISDEQSRTAEVQLETVRALADREQHSLPANLIGWIATIALAFAFPDPAMFAIPIAIRLVSICATRITGSRLRKRLDAREPYANALLAVKISLCMGGVSWGLLIWPVAAMNAVSEPAIPLIAFIMVGISLITSMIGAIPRTMVAFLACFAGSASIGFIVSGEPVPFYVAVGFGVTLAAAATFSLGAARQTRRAASAIVENRRLGEELTEALAHAEFLSQRDPLTGLLNRRAFFDQPGAQTASQQGSGHLLLIDLDHFKRINDSFGHGIGDRVLAATGDAMREVLRSVPGKGHRAARLGGEEFAVLLSGVDPEASKGIAELLRLRIAAISEEIACPGLSVRASIGVAPLDADGNVAHALEEADRALYDAKADGRDRVVLKAA